MTWWAWLPVLLYVAVGIAVAVWSAREEYRAAKIGRHPAGLVFGLVIGSIIITVAWGPALLWSFIDPRKGKTP